MKGAAARASTKAWRITKYPPFRWHAALAFPLGLCLASAVQAGLGEPVDSVARDHASLHGTALQVTPTANYEVHEIATAGGARVREYVSRAGTVSIELTTT